MVVLGGGLFLMSEVPLYSPLLGSRVQENETLGATAAEKLLPSVGRDLEWFRPSKGNGDKYGVGPFEGNGRG